MAFNKTGTPAPVSSVTASCDCDRCSNQAICMLRDGRYLCPTCLSEKIASEAVEVSTIRSTAPSVIQASEEEGQNGVS